MRKLIDVFKEVVPAVNNGLVNYSTSRDKSERPDFELEATVRSVGQMLGTDQVEPSIPPAIIEASAHTLRCGPTAQGNGYWSVSFLKLTQYIAWEINQALATTAGAIIGPSGRLIQLSDDYRDLTYSAVGYLSDERSGIFNLASKGKRPNIYSEIDILDIERPTVSRFKKAAEQIRQDATVGRLIEWYLTGERLKGAHTNTRREVGDRLEAYGLVARYKPFEK